MAKKGIAVPLVLTALLALTGEARSERVVADFVFGLADGLEIYGTLANSGPSSSKASYPVVEAVPPDGCSPMLGSKRVAGAIVIASRGGCSFESKLRNAEAAGASLLAIYGTVEAAYVNSSASYALANPCAVDCGAGSFSARAVADGPKQRALGFPEQCASRCASSVCAVAGVLSADTVGSGDALQLCCLPDELLIMNLGGAAMGAPSAPSVPAVYILRPDARRLLAAAAAGEHASARERGSLSVDPSFLLIWATGLCAVTVAAWLATASERHAASLVLPDGTRAKPALEPERTRAAGAGEGSEEETLDLTASHALAFVGVASLSLVAMFVLLQMGVFLVIRVVQVLFCLGCVTALFQFGFFPLVAWAFPRLERAHCCAHAWLGSLSVADALALGLSAGLVVWYFVCRHASYAWVLQDLMALAMCAMFLKTVRLPNVRVGAVLLSLFFVYDVFMVFLSPLLFHKSVMVEVATAGAGGEARQELSADGRMCQRIAGERMPVLFMIPRLGFGGGYAMLGLGDVVMPGLLVCFALRYDCATRAPRFLFGPARARLGGRAAGSGGSALVRAGWARLCCPGVGYFVLLVGGYALGLLLALLANVFGLTFNGVRGQPALLYLVPCTLGLLLPVALGRGELRDMWLADGLLSREGRDEDGYERHGSDEEGLGPSAAGRQAGGRDSWADASETHAPLGAASSSSAASGMGGCQSAVGASSAGVRSRELQGRPLLQQ